MKKRWTKITQQYRRRKAKADGVRARRRALPEHDAARAARRQRQRR